MAAGQSPYFEIRMLQIIIRQWPVRHKETFDSAGAAVVDAGFQGLARRFPRVGTNGAIDWLPSPVQRFFRLVHA
jgi:hypothetical protein